MDCGIVLLSPLRCFVHASTQYFFRVRPSLCAQTHTQNHGTYSSVSVVGGLLRGAVWHALGGVGVFVEAVLAVDAVAREGRVGLEFAFDHADGRLPCCRWRCPTCTCRGGRGKRSTSLALLVEKADAVDKALAWLGRGGAEGSADVGVLGHLDAADLAAVVFLLVDRRRTSRARAHAHVEVSRDEGRANLHDVALASFWVIVHHECFVFAAELEALANDVG
eukprot:scaffold16154_cov122-Isochrysis_galbana.AAC.1